MIKQTFRFSNSSTDFYFAAGFSLLGDIIDLKNAIFLTDENIFGAHAKKFGNHKTIVLQPGEDFKVQATVDSIIDQLIAFEADRKTTLIGVGGGVITDITGFVAGIYMRGIPFGFVPTSLLALVDASIGGKNGIDRGVYKNIVGMTRQPSFILQDLTFLDSLPETEWQNGFAEIIKHASIRDASMFTELQKHSVLYYRKHKKQVGELIQRNALLKIKVVQGDEFEHGDRRLLNFGHTLGHALENQYELSHGQAISIGMAYAGKVSKQLLGFKQADQLVNVIEQYGLPAFAAFDNRKVFGVLKMDKKRVQNDIHYILLQKIGKGVIQTMPVNELESIIQKLL